MSYLLAFVLFIYYELLVLAPDLFRSTIGHFVWAKPVAYVLAPLLCAIAVHFVSHRSATRVLERIFPVVLLILVPISAFYLHQEGWGLFIAGLTIAAILAYLGGLILCLSTEYILSSRKRNSN